MSQKPKKPAKPKADKARRPTGGELVRGAPRVISLIILLGVAAFIGVLFFRVMAAFMVPLFLAAVLTVVCKPMHSWVLARLNGRKHLAALVSTSLIALMVLAPSAYFVWKAFVETTAVVEYLSKEEVQANIVERFGGRAVSIESWVRSSVDEDFTLQEFVKNGSEYIKSVVQSKALGWGASGFAAVVSFCIGLAITVFALYYFFADGPAIVESLMHLSPLDDDYERQLLNKFTSVSRAVVLATLLSAMVQGLLAGIGYYFALEPGAPIFLLTVLTMLLAIVPFVGATAVWIPVALWVFFLQEGGFWPGILLAIYGGGLVSTIDNVIKPLVLHGQSNLHPLLALLSVLGGLQLLGPIGILVGPMLVAFMQALLEMVRKELDILQAEAAAAETPSA